MSTVEKAAKKALRTDIGERTAKLSEDEIAGQAHRCQQAVLNMPEYQAAKRLSVYLAMPSGEMRTNLIVRDALECGKEVFVPYLHSVPKSNGKTGMSKVMDMLQLKSIQEFESLRKDSWGIPTLDSETVASRENALGGHGLSIASDGVDEFSVESRNSLDLMIVPGVAFDVSMARLGHGAGFYDKYLTKLASRKSAKMPVLVGICLSEQSIDIGKIVMQTWDWRMDFVISGDGQRL